MTPLRSLVLTASAMPGLAAALPAAAIVPLPRHPRSAQCDPVLRTVPLSESSIL